MVVTVEVVMAAVVEEVDDVEEVDSMDEVESVVEVESFVDVERVEEVDIFVDAELVEDVGRQEHALETLEGLHSRGKNVGRSIFTLGAFTV